MPLQREFPQYDLSGAVQTKTSYKLRKRTEVKSSKNAAYNIKLGAAVRRNGYEQVGETIESGKNGLGAGVYRYFDNNKVVVGINDISDANATVRYLSNGGYWNTIIDDAPVNTKFQFLNHLDQLFVAGKSGTERMNLRNIDSSLTDSTTRNVLNAPKAAFIAEYGGRLYAMNVEVGGKVYADRLYESSPALGAVTFVNTSQSGLLQQLRVDSTKYLKPGMTVDIYGKGTEAKKVDSLTIVSVDKNNNRITFQATQIDVNDNDEIWLEDTKGQLNHFWNVDDPTPEDADYIRVTPGPNSDPDVTGWTENGNRLIVFTEDTMWRWDGSNFVNISKEIGCTSHESIKQIGSWTIWLHTTGIWVYSVNSGQPPKLISRGFENYIKAITQSGFRNATANVIDRVYKLAVGEIQELDSATTSTSTSSTSTSSTSSSTSSTSTSSTSTSSTSTSTSITTTSTSTSSTSTSSTSTSTTVSTTTISTSTSSTSTSTTTTDAGREVYRYVYDFDLNQFWTETHKREIRDQFNHTMHGYKKPYFIDDTGRLFRDDTGNKDHNDTIPMDVEMDKSDFNLNLKKTYIGVSVSSENARTAQLSYSVDNGPFDRLAQLDEETKESLFSHGVKGTNIKYRFTHNDSGDPPAINGLSTYYSAEEVNLG